MLFNSFEFIFLFLPIVAVIYFTLNRYRMTVASRCFLLSASLFFYSWWNIAYLPLLLMSMAFNYSLGTALCNAAVRINKKALLIFGISANLAALGYYKYTDFLITNVNTVLHTEVAPLNLALPLAISFFTFQQIAYLVDSYKRETHEYNFMNYAVFVSFFPQLIAGPIVHHKEMMPQFSMPRNLALNYNHILIGLFLFALGLTKKIVIADSFAIWANYGFNEAESLSTIDAWITSLSYSFQLYFDFSGYCDMAMGAALIFNIKLPFNFNSPYKALNIQQFWRQWHITLSRFLRDYIYVPLGGNRNGRNSTSINIIITFALGGLWHGAGWGFLIWGLMHGLALSILHYWSLLNIRMHKALAWFITFNFVNIGWIFFRAEDVDRAMKILKSMFAPLPNLYSLNLVALSAIAIAFVIVLALPNTNKIRDKKSISWFEILLVSSLFFLAITTFIVRRSSEFLYFQF